jgi:signal transduction histidine kinase
MRGFRAQLTLTVAAVALATLALISLLANICINIAFTKHAEEQQQTHAMDIAATLGHQFNGQTGAWDTAFIHGVGMAAMVDGYIIRLVDAEGAVVWDAENHDMETCSQVMMEIMTRMEQKRPGLNGKFVSRDFALSQDGQQAGTLSIRYYGPYFLSESDFHFLDSLNLVLLAVALLALLCSLAAGSFLAKRISRPVIQTAQIAAQIAGGNYKIRFEGHIGTRELDELVAAVNHMAQSLDIQESLRERLTNDVAHELRTPLTAVASHLEAILEGVWEPTPERLQSCYEEIGRIAGLVSDMERLAQVENENLTLRKTPLDLLALVSQVAGNFESEAAKKSIAIDVSGESFPVTADRDRLNQVFANLLSNALKYTPENGHVRIAVKDTPEGGAVIVEDNGIGIPKDELPLIFKRFYRTDQSRSRGTGGAGIGLTIVKAIVEAHSGRIDVESKAGQGSCFTVTLPKANG